MSATERYFDRLASQFEEEEDDDGEYKEDLEENEDDVFMPGRLPPVRQRKPPQINLITSWKRSSRFVKWAQRVLRGLGQSTELAEVGPDAAAARLAQDALPVVVEILNQFGRELIVRSIAMAEADPHKTRKKRTKSQLAALGLSSSDSSTLNERILIISELHVRAALQSLGMLQFVQAGDTILNSLAGQKASDPPLCSLNLNVLPGGPVKLNPLFLQVPQVSKPTAKRKRTARSKPIQSVVVSSLP